MSRYTFDAPLPEVVDRGVAIPYECEHGVRLVGSQHSGYFLGDPDHKDHLGGLRAVVKYRLASEVEA